MGSEGMGGIEGIGSMHEIDGNVDRLSPPSTGECIVLLVVIIGFNSVILFISFNSFRSWISFISEFEAVTCFGIESAFGMGLDIDPLGLVTSTSSVVSPVSLLKSSRLSRGTESEGA